MGRVRRVLNSDDELAARLAAFPLLPKPVPSAIERMGKPRRKYRLMYPGGRYPTAMEAAKPRREMKPVARFP